MDEQLNDRLVHAIQEQIPGTTNVASVLMETLSLGKEAVYRRLRGEVMYSFEDVAKISRKLGISLDEIVSETKGSENNAWAFFNLNSISFNYPNKYADQLKKRLDASLLFRIKGHKGTARFATSALPNYLTTSLPGMAMFRHYKRAYLAEGINPEFKLSDMVIPTEYLELERAMIGIPSNLSKQLLILGRRCFETVIDDIKYFCQRDLISDQERMQLKDELFSILLQLEKIAATGVHNEHVEVSFYLADVNIESIYFHIEADNFETAMQMIYFTDGINFFNHEVCQMQKEWIESLKRYSTLISQTGEVARLNFFKTQRELINTL